MSDLIERDKVKETIRAEWVRHAPMEKDPLGAFVLSAIDDIPTAEPTIGNWIDDEDCNTEYGYYFANCSECDYQIDVHENRGYYNYCPNCGAKMKGASDEHTDKRH